MFTVFKNFFDPLVRLSLVDSTSLGMKTPEQGDGVRFGTLRALLSLLDRTANDLGLRNFPTGGQPFESLRRLLVERKCRTVGHRCHTIRAYH